MARWKLPDQEVALRAKLLAEEMALPETFASVLVNRGVRTPSDADAFLLPDRSKLSDPMLLPDMEKALERLLLAVERREKVFVCGDYDVDGITSIVLIKRCLAAAGLDTGFHIPNRMTDGYGLSERGMRAAREHGADLIVTVDSGVTGHDEVRLAKELGMDVIVTDHHEPQGDLPEAVAVIDAKRADSNYPYKDLAGVGVAFKLMEALARELREVAHTVEENTDLVAVGTVADIVPLTSENRILTTHGIARLRETSNVGLRALMKVAGIDPWTAEAYHIGFAIGPRLNAAGRLGDAGVGVLLLTSEDPVEAERIARSLDRENAKRRSLEAHVLEGATRMIEEGDLLTKRRSIVLWSRDWHPGVIGIVASRISRKHCRPTVLVSLQDGLGKGSGRSIPGFDLHGALTQCSDILTSFGGHRHAAGLSLSEDRLREFDESFERVAAEVLSPEDMVPVVAVDALVSLDKCDFELAKLLKQVGPFGAGNPEPVLGTRGLRVLSARVVGKGHLKLSVADTDHTMDAIGFGMGSLLGELKASGRRVGLAYVLEENTWQGVTDLQLRLKDVQQETP